MMSTINAEFTRLLKMFTTKTELAEMLGIQSATISMWIARGNIPETRAFQIQVLTKGRIRASKLLRRK